MSTAAVVRTILWVDIIGMSLFALLYLRQRRLSWWGYWGWGLLALLLPVLGPFLVIANRPGEWKPAFSFRDDFQTLANFFRQLLPDPKAQRKMGTLDQARVRRQRRGNSKKGK